MLSRIFSHTLRSIEPSSRLAHRSATSGRRRTKRTTLLTRTSILMQEGTKIHEVAMIVQRSQDIDRLLDNKNEITPFNGKSDKIQSAEKRREIQIETAEGTAILYSSDIFESLENGTMNNNFPTRPMGPIIKNMITDEINCRVALEALKEIMKLETDEDSYKIIETNLEDQPVSNGREKVLRQLIEMIAKTRGNEMIIEALRILVRDRLSLPKNRHKDRLCDELLIRATNGQVNLPQLCELSKILSSYEDSTYRETFDAFWIVIKIRESDIDENNLSSLFKLISHFRDNRTFVKAILSKKLSIYWWKLSGVDFSEILDNARNDDDPGDTLDFARKWSRMCMNTASEVELLDFMSSSMKMKFLEKSNLEKSLARYTRDRGLATKNPALIALIMSYCGKHRIRNSQIFDICAKYLIINLKNIPTSLLAPILVPFGYLNYAVPGGETFWQNFENLLALRFSRLETNDALNILLSLIYLQRKPFELVDRVFTRDFLDKLHGKNDTATIMYLREKLRLLDRAMAFEDSGYTLRMIPEPTSERTVYMRARIKRVTNLIYRQLSEIIGGGNRLSRIVMLGPLSNIDLYTLDVLIHSKAENSSIFSLTRKNNIENGNIAVFIHLPEHYCRDSTILIGPQEMRIRHLRKLGFKVMTLNYKILLTLRHLPDEMSDYLLERLRSAGNT